WDQLREKEPTQAPEPPSLRTLSELDRLLKEGSERDALTLRELTEAQHESSDLAALREGGVCPRCHQRVRVEEFAQHERDARQRLARCEAARSEIAARIDSLRTERASREAFERVTLQWEGLERERKSARSQLEHVGEDIRHLEEQTAEVGTRLGEARARLASLEPSTREYASVQSELGRLEKLLDQGEREAAQRREALETVRRLEENATAFEAEAQRIRDESAELEAEAARSEVGRVSLIARLEGEAPSRERAEQLREERKALLAKVAPSVEQRSRSEAAVEQFGRDIARAEEGVAERRRLRSEALHLQKLADWVVGPFREALLQIERRLLSQAQSEFDRMFSRYFATLVEDPSLQARCDSAFTPTVEIEGEWTPAEALSGGERTALALAFRLALGAVVRQLGRLKLETLVLDEPTDGFSPEQVVRMGELLRELGIPQILLVSHEAQLAGIADRVIRVEKESGESRLVEAATDRPGPGSPAAEVLAPSEPKSPSRRRLRRAVAAPTPGNDPSHLG
ncbi:MAG TPA: hypothetical protein VJS68_01725, partial [Thermoplasmata archaeon]|nr:hypothetical protein [Thermoplasmata archaeon]